jgi:hypothetical protein
LRSFVARMRCSSVIACLVGLWGSTSGWLAAVLYPLDWDRR